MISELITCNTPLTSLALWSDELLHMQPKTHLKSKVEQKTTSGQKEQK